MNEGALTVSTNGTRALALVVAGALITGAAVAFVRLKSLQVEAGYRVHDLRMRLVTLDQQRAALEVERASLSRPQRLAHMARTQLGLVHIDATLAAPLVTPPVHATTTTTTTVAGSEP
jgi:hypothetical protein